MSEALGLSEVSAGYGETVVLDRVDLTLAAGGTVAVLGRNGVGKTTLLATVMGHTTLHSGTIRLAGADITRFRIHQRARAGIGYVPQEREIFPSLDVAENLMVARRAGAWDEERVYALFPLLAERRGHMGNQLSGGEQQMLAVGRALMGNPSLLLMDEPLEGLAPVIVEELLTVMAQLKEGGGLSIVLVEQHTRLALEFTEQAIVLDRGRVVYEGTSRTLLDQPSLLDSLIGVGGGET
ncbi:MAG: ABC transporter ATP-binding protein [Alphaproteobacteria bacterium]